MIKEQTKLYLEILEEKLKNEQDSYKAKAIIAKIKKYKKGENK